MFSNEIKEFRSRIVEIDKQVKSLEKEKEKCISKIYDFVHEKVPFETLRDEFLKIVDSGEYQLKNKQIRKMNLTRDSFEIKKSSNPEYKMFINLTPPRYNFDGSALREYELIFRHLSFVLFGERDLILYDLNETDYDLKSIKIF